MSSGAVIGGVLAFATGAVVALQAPINALLARGVGSPLLAATISFAAGLAVLVAISVIAIRGVDPGWRDIPLWLFVSGGCLGALFVGSVIVLTPMLGAARMLALVVAGQMIAGVVADHFGWFGLAVKEISLGRVSGAAIVIAGAILLSLS